MDYEHIEVDKKIPYSFCDLIDTSAFAQLLENFFRTTGIPNGVVDANGELLSMSSGANVCAVFHRTHPVAAERCRDSNLALMRSLHDGCISCELCRNGLLDYATPVVIEGQPLATLFLGQVLHAPPDMAFFRAQAARLGFNEEAYLKSIAAVPVIDKTRLQDLMAVMVDMAKMLAASGLSRLRQSALERDINTQVERNMELKSILDFSPDAIFWSEDDTSIQYVNRRFTQLFGYTIEDLSDLEAWSRLAYPVEDYRAAVIVPWRKTVALARQNNTPPPELEADITCKDGTVRRVVIRASWVGQRRLVSFADITERKRIENVLRHSREILADAQRVALLGSWDWNVADGQIEWSEMAYEIYTPDKRPAKLAVEDFKSVLHPDDQERVVAAVQAAFEHDTPIDLEHRVSSVSKGERIVRAQGKVFRDANGKPIRMVGTVQDITEHKRMELALADREREFRTLAEHLPDFMVRFDRDARFVYANPSFETAIGHPLSEMRGKTPTQIAGLPDAPYIEQAIRKVAETGVAIELEREVTTPDEGTFYGLVSITPELDPTGRVEFVQSVIHDITRRWQSEQRNQAHDAMLEMIARDADLTDILTALVRHIESEDKTSLCSIMLADMEGKHLLTGAAPSLPAFYNQAVNGIEIGVGFGSCGTAAALGERMVVEDVTTHAYWKPYAKLAQEAGLRACWSEPVLSSKGKVLGTFAIYHTEPKCPQAADFERIVFATNLAAIAIENRFTHEELERRAYTDYLTGLANRRHFLELAENELARTVRYGKEMSMLMLDLDHFKQVNDTFGHQVGDLVLKRLAELCRTTLRDVDIVGRIGGEEFAVLLPETGNQQAMDAAERLRATIAAAHVTLGSGLPVRFSASFGVTTLQEKDINIDILLNQADQALYRAKNEGRNCVRLYSAGNDDR